MAATQLKAAQRLRGVDPGLGPFPLNDGRGFMSSGEIEVSGTDPSWRDEDGARVFRHPVTLEGYGRSLRPAIQLSVVKLDADATSAWEVRAEHEDDPRRFLLTIILRGKGKLRAIGIQ